MTVATIAPAASKFVAKVSASSFEFNGESRPLTADEFERARYVVRRWKSARAFVASRFGHAAETEEWLQARGTYDGWLGTEAEYLAAAETDPELLLPEQLRSYAAYSATLYDNGSAERAMWLILARAELDVACFLDSLANDDFWHRGSGVDGCPALTIGGRMFTSVPQGDKGPEGDRLFVRTRRN